MKDSMKGEDVSTEMRQPVLDLVADMTSGSIERSGLEPEALMMVRLAALVAIDAPPASYVTNLAVAEEAGVTVERLQDVLIAVAPVVGTPRIVSAITSIAEGLGMVVEASDGDAG